MQVHMLGFMHAYMNSCLKPRWAWEAGGWGWCTCLYVDLFAVCVGGLVHAHT